MLEFQDKLTMATGRLIMRPLFWLLVVAAARAESAERDFRPATAPLLKQFCFDCHTGKQSEANIDLERTLAASSLDASFKTWQKVAGMIESGKMPPSDAPQPSAAERQTLVELVRGALQSAAKEVAGDPGPVLVRRLTSAEYAYTIQDLTGLDLDLDKDFVSDAVGGEGFTNAGNAQFIEDATLERYLEAAKRISNHAVIGAGPLRFFRDPGKTGRELSAIDRINKIYRQYGFRTGAGEGGEPFGLDRYPKAFYAAWRYQHRQKLNLPGATLASLAAEEGLGPRFVEHVWSVLTSKTTSFPTSEIMAGWRGLPVPQGPSTEVERQVRAQCDELYKTLFGLQKRLAATVGDEEEAAVLSDRSLSVAASHSFTARLIFPPEATVIRLQFSVLPGVPGQDTVPVVIWRNPRIRFRRLTRRRDEPQPLAAVLSADDAKAFAFGQHPTGAGVGPQDFVTKGAATRSFDVEVAEGVRGAELLVEAQLDLANSQDCVVRCEISGGDKEKKLASISAALLANPLGDAFAAWKVGVLEFARLLPQVSHREAAPADRDPIPPPFDNTYNMPERNFFHAKVKYHRDDQFLVEKLLDEAARKQLDQAWTDLLTSFEYHDVLLRFVAEKYNVDLHSQTIANLDDSSIGQFPVEQREYVRNLRTEYVSMQQALRAAEAGHVDDVLTFAGRAWRRPLREDEKNRLRSFYEALRTNAQLSHADATRTLLARTLVAPEFLYRLEKSADQEQRVALSDWELATRLSYFLWSSLPDEELTRAAAAGELHEPQQLARQASRMLADPKARRLATEFFGQWLGFYQFDRHRGVDPQRFPEFTDKLKSALYDEAITFFEHVVREDRPVGEILFADYAFLNRDLAQHYGIQADVSAATPTRIDDVNRFHRGGLTGLGAVLTVTSAPLRTSPVKRGDWILRRVLGTPVPPPPADAGSIAADDVATTGPRTVRERLDAHRRDPACTNCHSRIDPLGFTLEHYDPIGRWREAYRDGAAIDVSGVFADGKTISGPDGLREYLKSQEPQFHRTLCTKLLGYALGRGELLGDQPLLEEMTAGLATSEGRFSDLIKKIVTSPQFRYHRGQSDAQ